jgi:hypothetical protein
MLLNQTLAFGEWLPDQPDLGNSVTVVKNAIPGAKSYHSINDLSAATTALASAPLGAFWCQDSGGGYELFAGDSGSLYRLSSTTFNDISKSGGYTAENWEFTKWGERVIAVDGETSPQYYDMGMSTLFDDLPGTPPKASHIAVVRDFIVLGNLNEGGTDYPGRIRWSGFNNSEKWTSSQSTQSDYQDLLGRGGAVQRIVPGETGIIFQEYAIRRMTYTGPPTIFRIDEEEKDRGCLAPNSVTWFGDLIFFLSHDGFFVKAGFNPSTPIGTEKIDNFFFSDFSGSDFSLVRGAVDKKNKLVVWAYPSKETGENRLLAYRWDVQKWSIIDVNSSFPTEYAVPSLSLDDLDAVLTDIDTDSINMESTAYLGGNISLGVFDSTNKLGTFGGNPLDATIETGEASGRMGKRMSLKSIRPLADGSVSICVGTRNNQNENYNYGLPRTVNAKGEISARTSARYHRIKAVISGGFREAQGVEVFYREEGRK